MPSPKSIVMDDFDDSWTGYKEPVFVTIKTTRQKTNFQRTTIDCDHHGAAQW